MSQIRILAVVALTVLALAAPPGAAHATARDSMLAQINAVRSYVGLHPYRLSPTLNRSSYGFAHYLMRRDRFAHARRIRASGFRMLGEVLEKHSGHGPRVRGTLLAWLRSPGHRAVLLSRRYYWIGLGRVAGRFQGRRTTIWVGQVGRR